MFNHLSPLIQKYVPKDLSKKLLHVVRRQQEEEQEIQQRYECYSSR